MSIDVDILMVTYNRPVYTEMSLTRLFETCPAGARVWIWHNGDDRATLDVVRSFEAHPLVERVRHSPENRMLREPTNWFWQEAAGRLLGKVDDDCLMPDGWCEALCAAHEANEALGVISAWPFLPEDFRPRLARRKIRSVSPSHQLMVNPWVGGSGYLMKRACLESVGELREGENFSGLCIRSALHGWLNGWIYPFIYMDHMDDPRSPNTGLRSQEDFQRSPGLSARRFGIGSLETLLEQTIQAAVEVQAASANPRAFVGFRAKLRRARRRLANPYRRARFNT